MMYVLLLRGTWLFRGTLNSAPEKSLKLQKKHCTVANTDQELLDLRQDIRIKGTIISFHQKQIQICQLKACSVLHYVDYASGRK